VYGTLIKLNISKLLFRRYSSCHLFHNCGVVECLTDKKNQLTAVPAGPDNATSIFPKGEQMTNNNFIGNAWLQQMILSDSLNPIQVGSVTFDPGARTNWHLHPGGQILLITAGTGYYQEKDSPKRIIKKGEVIKCPPNVPHWHGASKDDELIQIAITNTQKGTVVWQHPVSDKEYNH
jgi:quercetin dioxygenase-like cupin family protein